MTQNINLELKLLLTLEEKKLSSFTINDAKDILKTSSSSVWHVLYRLVQKRRIRRIERGKYLLIPAKAVDGNWSEYFQILLPNLIDVYYIGFYTAMDYWNMTEQIPQTVFVATTKRKQNLEFGYQNYKFITLSKKNSLVLYKRKYTKITISISLLKKRRS